MKVLAGTSNSNLCKGIARQLKLKLINTNIKNIDNIEKDTFLESKFFYSYRRSCINKEQDYGRCISVILMT